MQADKLRELRELLYLIGVIERDGDHDSDRLEDAEVSAYAYLRDNGTELLALAEGAEADRADARRWRFLRDDVNLSHVFDEIPNGDGFAFKQGADLDAAIDAALAGAVTQGQPEG